MPSDLGKWFVRGSDDSMTPFSAFATTRWQYGPESLVRYNGSAAFEIQGENASGFSSGAAMDKMEALANNLPAGTTWAWSGMSLQEKTRQRPGDEPLRYLDSGGLPARGAV